MHYKILIILTNNIQMLMNALMEYITAAKMQHAMIVTVPMIVLVTVAMKETDLQRH